MHLSPARRQSPDGARRAARAARLLEPRRRRGGRGAGRALVGRRVGGALDVQPLRDLRRQRRSGARPRRDRGLPQRLPRAPARRVPRRTCSSYDDAAAAQHLFRVAAGLDSLVVGEPQILGQVKDAFQTAAERRCTGPLLSKMFHWAFGVGKRVRTETALGEGAVSVELRRGGAGAEDLRPPRRPARAGRRRRRDQHADRAAPAQPGRRRDRHHQPHGRARRGARGRGRRTRGAVGRAATARRQRRHRRHRHRIAAADHHARGRRGGHSGAGAPTRCSSSTSPCRATSKRRSARSSRCSSTTSTTCRASCRRTCRGAARRSRAPRPSSPRSWRGSRRGSDRAAPFRPSSRCGSGSTTSAAPSCSASTAELAGLPPEARARVDEVTRLIVEKLLLEPTEQLKALPDEETQVAYTEAVNRLFRLR